MFRHTHRDCIALKYSTAQNRVDPITRAAAGEEGRWNIAWNRRGRPVASKGRGTRIDDARKVGSRSNSGEGIARTSVLFIKVVKQDRGCVPVNSAPAEEAHDADLVGIDAPFLGVSADEADQPAERR